MEQFFVEYGKIGKKVFEDSSDNEEEEEDKKKEKEEEEKGEEEYVCMLLKKKKKKGDDMKTKLIKNVSEILEVIQKKGHRLPISFM